MGEQTQIEWADATVNFAWGCTKVSQGCENCYMFRLSETFGKSSEFHILSLENQKRKLRNLKSGSKVFVNSMSDTFHEQAQDATIDLWFDIMRNFRSLKFIVLTKRINRAYNFFRKRPVPDNVWLGTSVENRAELHRMEKLKKINAKTRFISFEPLLENIGEVDLTGIHWVIVGGESDFKNPRIMTDYWAYNIKKLCEKYQVPFFFKQMGGSHKDKATGTWGTDKLLGKEYKQMPDKLATKYSEDMLKLTELLEP